MKKKFVNCLLFVIMLVISLPAFTLDIGELIDKAMQGDHRNPAFVLRDQYRHPKETLEFFGLKPYLNVVEIWPSRGWYTEILAPIFREYGTFYAAGFALSAHQTPDWQKEIQIEFEDKLSQRPDVYDHVVVTGLSIPERTTIAPPGTIDIILTFRNVHNWMKGGYTQGMLETFYRILRPGGVLGIVEHRAAPGTPFEQMVKTGYVTQEFIKALAQAVGFNFEASSEINANPKDTKDYPAGVWTLPPTLRLCKEMKNGSDKEACSRKYTAIGESDRMTLRFRKPY